LSEALEQFAAHDARKAELVELSSFPRLTNEQTAQVLAASKLLLHRLPPAQGKRHN